MNVYVLFIDFKFEEYKNDEFVATLEKINIDAE